jgi:hypothetical protein
MTAFKPGTELGRRDLNIFLKTRTNNPKNAAEITYDIYYLNCDVEVLMPPANRTPINASVGEYYASFVIPMGANPGTYRIRWKFRQSLGSPLNEVVQEFSVITGNDNLVTIPDATPTERDVVHTLRIMLRDNNPDRNYHFVPPAGEESINQFTRVFGYIWEDCELLEYLSLAVDAINLRPPLTTMNSIDEMISQMRPWRSLIIYGGMFHALFALSINWTAEEFDYTIGGVSLSIDKSSKYQSLADDISDKFTEQTDAAKETVKFIRGLKQSKFGVGIRSSFGPSVGRGALTPRRFLGI